MIVAVALVLCGCGVHGRVNSTAPLSPALAAGTIVFNVSEDPHSLDPLLARSDDERQLARLTFDMLLDVDTRGRPQPALATQVPTIENGGISADGRTITYRLRRGVRWQDGAAFTARDVLFTWRAAMDPRNSVAGAAGYELIAGIAAPDPFTVIVRLKYPWAPAVQTLFTYGNHPLPILPAHVLEGADRAAYARFGVHPIGTGPFALVSWERTARLVYQANPLYYRGAPRAARLVALVVPDFNTDLMLLRSRQLDWSLLSPAQRLSLGAAPGVRIVYAPFSGFGALVFNARRPPFDDARLRRAIAAAIDRARLSAAITSGQYPVTDSDQPPFSWAYDATARLPSFDPTAADRMLDALGWLRAPDGTRTRRGVSLQIVLVVFPESDTALRTATYVQQMLAARGVAATIKRVTLAQFYLPRSAGGLLLSGAFDMAYMAWRSGEDPDDSELVTCAGVSNYAGYCNPQVDALEARALTEMSQDRRSALYGRIQHVLAHDVPYLYLYAPNYGYATSQRLRGFSPTPFSPMSDAWRWSKD